MKYIHGYEQDNRAEQQPFEHHHGAKPYASGTSGTTTAAVPIFYVITINYNCVKQKQVCN